MDPHIATGTITLQDFLAEHAINQLLPETVTLPSAEEVYDTIMGGIEPELTTAVLPTLKDTYKNETEKQKKARQQRYGKAYTEYEKQFSQYVSELRAQGKVLQHSARKLSEESSKNEEVNRLDQISSTIDLN